MCGTLPSAHPVVLPVSCSLPPEPAGALPHKLSPLPTQRGEIGIPKLSFSQSLSSREALPLIPSELSTASVPESESEPHDQSKIFILAGEIQD